MAEDNAVTQIREEGRKRKRVKRKYVHENVRREEILSNARVEFSKNQENKRKSLDNRGLEKISVKRAAVLGKQ